MIKLDKRQKLENVIIKIDLLANALGAWDTTKVDPSNADMEALSEELHKIKLELEVVLD